MLLFEETNTKNGYDYSFVIKNNGVYRCKGVYYLSLNGIIFVLDENSKIDFIYQSNSGTWDEYVSKDYQINYGIVRFNIDIYGFSDKRNINFESNAIYELKDASSCFYVFIAGANVDAPIVWLKMPTMKHDTNNYSFNEIKNKWNNDWKMRKIGKLTYKD